jgi:hypothetical protein
VSSTKLYVLSSQFFISYFHQPEAVHSLQAVAVLTTRLHHCAVSSIARNCFRVFSFCYLFTCASVFIVSFICL